MRGSRVILHFNIEWDDLVRGARVIFVRRESGDKVYSVIRCEQVNGGLLSGGFFLVKQKIK